MTTTTDTPQDSRPPERGEKAHKITDYVAVPFTVAITTCTCMDCGAEIPDYVPLYAPAVDDEGHFCYSPFPINMPRCARCARKAEVHISEDIGGT